VQGVTEDKQGIATAASATRPRRQGLAIAKDATSPYATTEPEQVYAGKYPLSRFLFVYVNRAPGKPLDPLTNEFVKFALSHEGQEVVLKDGYLPLHAATVEQELAKLR